MKELMRIRYCCTYHTSVEYYGNRIAILCMLRLLDVWGSKGEYFSKEDLDIDEPYDRKYRFELSKEFYDYAKSDDFANAMRRVGIELEIY